MENSESMPQYIKDFFGYKEITIEDLLHQQAQCLHNIVYGLDQPKTKHIESFIKSNKSAFLCAQRSIIQSFLEVDPTFNKDSAKLVLGQYMAEKNHPLFKKIKASMLENHHWQYIEKLILPSHILKKITSKS